ncbi:glycosyltransferase family 2 protein [bacterium]|nr:glycosyltransferase family 2 protein [bacterium]
MSNTPDSKLEQIPFVSVIMPVRNEEDFIEHSLGSVLKQDYPEDRMEILVVDGNSKDGMRQKIQSPRVKILDNPAGIVPSSLNIGLRNAMGDVIIRVDGHCVLPFDYISNCVQVLRESGADCAGGRQKAYGEGVVGKVIALAMSSRFGVGTAYFHYGTKPTWVDTVYLGAYQRDTFQKTGGFDEELVRNQDDEFNFRLAQAGGKIRFDPKISANYYARDSISRLWKQYFEYGFYKVLVIRKRRAVSSIRQLAPSAFVIALLLSFILALVSGQMWIMATVLGPYLLANFGTSVFLGYQRIRTILLLPIVFGCMHIAYGVGFLAGLWRFKTFQSNVAAVPDPKDLTYQKH